MTATPCDRVLEVLAGPGVRWLGVADLAIRTGLPRLTVAGCLGQLQAVGLVTGPPLQPDPEWSITTTGQAALDIEARWAA